MKDDRITTPVPTLHVPTVRVPLCPHSEEKEKVLVLWPNSPEEIQHAPHLRTPFVLRHIWHSDGVGSPSPCSLVPMALDATSTSAPSISSKDEEASPEPEQVAVAPQLGEGILPLLDVAR